MLTISPPLTTVALPHTLSSNPFHEWKECVMSYSACEAVQLGFIPGSLYFGGWTNSVNVRAERRPELKNFTPRVCFEPFSLREE